MKDIANGIKDCERREFCFLTKDIKEGFFKEECSSFSMPSLKVTNIYSAVLILSNGEIRKSTLGRLQGDSYVMAPQ